MSFFNFGNRKSHVAQRPTKPRRLMTETLEDRQLLAVGVLSGDVMDTANIIELGSDVSIDSLKAAIAAAAQTREDDVIKIPASTLEMLSASDEIVIDVPTSMGGVWLVADGGEVTIDAGSYSRAFSVKSGNVTFEGLTVVNGSADFGGAIANSGNLTLADVVLQDNYASVSGGAIANKGTLAVFDSLITDNTSADGGSALYDGAFEWATTEPQWTTIPAQVGGKGETLTVNLGQYINAGSWSYSYAIAETTSSILASTPTLDASGNLSFRFIGDGDYYGEDDYSALAVTVTATDGSSAASTTFSVSLAEQTSVTVAAILSNMTYDDAVAEYVQGSVRRPTGYAAPSIPGASIVDTTDSMTVQIWMQDFDWTGNTSKVWDAGDYSIMGMQYRIHLENATITEFTARTGLCRDAYVYRELENGDYEFIIAYTAGANFGYTEALLLDVLTIEAVDPSQPVSATVYQINTDWTYPCYTRLYDNPTPRDPARSHINVDPSQTLFVSTISNSTDPLSAVPGQPFDTNIDRVSATSAEPELSNAVLGAAATTPKAYLYNVTVANNVSLNNQGAVYAATGSLVYAYNSIIAVNEGGDCARVGSGKIAAYYVLSGYTGWTNASPTVFAYDASQPLFNDVEARDYTLADDSQALDAGSNTYVDTLTDLVGASRIQNGVVDLGAYEKSLFSFSYESDTRLLTLTWAEIPGAVSYTVKMSKDGGATWANYATKIAGQSTTVKGVYVGKSYSFRVSGTSASGATLSAVQEATFAPISVSSTSGYYAPGAEITVKVTGAANSSASCRWYYVTEEGDVEIEEAAGLSKYTPTEPQYDVKVVATGTGVSKGSVAETTIVSTVPKLYFDYDASTRQAVLTWNAIPDAVSYLVKVSKDGGSTWVAYRKDLTETTTTATGLYVGKSYSYEVYGKAADGSTLELTRAATLAPIALTSSSTEFIAGDTITVTLSGAENSAADIKWYYATDDGDVEITEARGLLSYAPADGTYDVKVVATGTGDSKGSNSELVFASLAPKTTLVYDASTQTATVGWNKVGGASSYTVKVSSNGGATWTVAASGVTGTSASIANLAAGKSYDVVIVAQDASGADLRSYETVFAPVSVKANLDSYMAGDTITLTVTGASNASYEVKWYAVDASGEVEITAAAGKLSYMPADAETTIKVVVTGTGDTTGEVVETVLENTRTVGDITLKTYNRGSHQAIIQWDAIENAPNGYKVMISKDGGKTWIKYTTIADPTKTFVTINGVYANNSYQFQVYGINGKTLTSSLREGTIEPIQLVTNGKPYYTSTAKTVTLQAATPSNVDIRWYYVTDAGDVEIAEAHNQLSYKITTRTNEIKVVATGTGASAGFVSSVNIPRPNSTISFTETSSSKATLTWTELPGAATYIVKRSTDGGATWVTYKKDLTTESCEASGLYSGKTYMFSVTGYDADGKAMLSSITGTIDKATGSSSVVEDAFADFFEDEWFEEN